MPNLRVYKNGKRQCTGPCRRWLLPNIKNFMPHKVVKDGFHSVCRDCRNTRQNLKRKARVLFYQQYKAERGCAECGEKDPRCLTFHHPDPAIKELEVGQAGNYNWDRILAEIAKCDVLCCNCHAKRHIPLYT